jgi:hypothetical protein
MRIFRGFFMMSFITCAAPAVAFIDRMTERICNFLISLFAPEPMRIATGGPVVVRRIDRAALAPSLLENLRHEKCASKVGAHRSI